MKLEPIINEEFLEIDYHEGIIDNGATKTTYTIIKDDDTLHIEQIVTLGKKEIFRDSFILDLELVEALKEIDLI